MARLIRPIRKTQLLLLSLSNTPKTLIPKHEIHLHHNPNSPFQYISSRNYVSEMRKSVIQDNILRLLRNEIQYEFDHSPPTQAVSKFKWYEIDERPCEQWITLKRKFAEKEEIKIEATMFDAAIPSSSSSKLSTEMQLHITLVVNIFKGDGDVLEVLCSAWPNSIEITKLFIRSDRKKTNAPDKAYVGPGFLELDDELQDSLYDFLEARGIDDEMTAFLHEYMKNKEKTEYIRWMGIVKSYIEKK